MHEREVAEAKKYYDRGKIARHGFLRTGRNEAYVLFARHGANNVEFHLKLKALGEHMARLHTSIKDEKTKRAFMERVGQLSNKADRIVIEGRHPREALDELHKHYSTKTVAAFLAAKVHPPEQAKKKEGGKKESKPKERRGLSRGMKMAIGALIASPFAGGVIGGVIGNHLIETGRKIELKQGFDPAQAKPFKAQCQDAGAYARDAGTHSPDAGQGASHYSPLELVPVFEIARMPGRNYREKAEEYSRRNRGKEYLVIGGNRKRELTEEARAKLVKREGPTWKNVRFVLEAPKPSEAFTEEELREIGETHLQDGRSHANNRNWPYAAHSFIQAIGAGKILELGDVAAAERTLKSLGGSYPTDDLRTALKEWLPRLKRVNESDAGQSQGEERDAGKSQREKLDAGQPPEE